MEPKGARFIIIHDVTFNEDDFPCLKKEDDNSSKKIQENSKVKVIFSPIGNQIEVKQKSLDFEVKNHSLKLIVEKSSRA